MALESEDIQRIIEALTGLKDSIDSTTDGFAQTDNLVKKFNKDLKDTQPTTKAFKDIIAGTKTEIENIGVAAKKFDAAIKKARDSGDVVEEGNINQAKALTLNRIATHNAKAAAGNFAIGLGGVAKTMLSGATEFVKGLQGTAEGTELVTQASVAAAEATGKLATSIGTVMETFGLLFAILGPGKIVKGIGYGLSLLGIGLEAAAPALTELATAGVKVLGTEIEKTKKSFRDITSTGAEFAGGMTEMRKTAFIAGLDVAQLSQAVKANTENLVNMGLGITESTKRFAKISAEIRGSKLGIQLSNLGLTVEEQNEMIMLSSAMLNSSGKLRGMNEKEAAAAVVALTKDLKVLQAITGEDAKKKAQQARADSLEADVLSEARALGPEGEAKTQALLRQVPEALRVGMLELISTRGEAMSDPDTNILVSQIPGIKDAMLQGIDDLRNSSLTANEITQRAQDRFEALRVSLKDNPQALRDLARVTRLQQGGGVGAGAVKLGNQLIDEGYKTTIGNAKKTRESMDRAADTTDGLTKRISETDAAVQAMKASFGDEMTSMITTYVNTTGYAADALAAFTTATDNAKEALNSLAKSQNGSADTKTTKPTSDANKTSKGSVEEYNKNRGYPSMPTNTGKPYDLFGEIGKILEPTAEQKARRGFAQGGISTGPLSGYQEVLHGTEAVVPLPDNRSIPVTLNNNNQMNTGTMDTKEMVSAINQQSGLLNQILVAMEKNNQLTSGILQTSY